MKILVTGGAGFIGSNFVYHYLNRYPDRELVCLDAMTYAANPATLKGAEANPRFRLIKGDITHREEVFQLFREENFVSGHQFCCRKSCRPIHRRSRCFSEPTSWGLRI